MIGHLEGDPLNPETHRAHIVAIDAIVFEDGGLTEAGREQLKNTLNALAEAVSTDKTNTIALRLAQDMRTRAAGLERTSVGTPLADSELRNQWSRIRGSLFEDAAWFRRSPADPIEPATPPPPPPSPLRAANAEERAGLEEVLASLSDLIERAKRDLPNACDSEPHREFVTEAGRKLSADASRLGPQPPVYGIDVSYRDAHRSAAEALRAMRILMGVGTGAPTSSREFLIRKADLHVLKAREAVAGMR